MINILLIGAGQIGSRHLQALALLDLPANIDVVDPSKNSRIVAKERFDEIKSAANKPSIHLFDAIEKAQKHYDVALITTDSRPRRKIVEQLVQHSTVKYLVLEKFLFPRIEDYVAISNLLKEHQITTFVNTARRLYEDYQMIAELFQNTENIHFKATGSHWGLGCNGIHFLDLFAMVCNSTKITLETDLVDKELVSSKRNNYTEFSGTLKGFDDKKNTLEIASYNEGDEPLKVEIFNEKLHIRVNERSKEIIIKTKDLESETKPFTIKYQSQLTQGVVKKLIQKGTCQLTPYEESSELHQVFLMAFLKHYNEITGENSDICPIT